MRKLLVILLCAVAWAGTDCESSTISPAIAPCSPELGYCGPIGGTVVVPVAFSGPSSVGVLTTPGCNPTSDPTCGAGLVPIGRPTLH